jgi:1-acyl-sn-glycerol-3-phosphate acyltransferase
MAAKIDFEEDISKMFNVNDETEDLALLLEKTKSTEQLVMRIWAENESDDKTALIAIVDTLAEIIDNRCGDLLNELKTHLPQDDLINGYSIIAQNFVVFIDPRRYDEQTLIPLTRLDSILDGYIRTMSTAGSIFAREGLLYDPAGFAFDHLMRMKEMQTFSEFVAIDGYLFSRDEKNILIVMIPKNKYGETKNNAVLIAILDEIVERFNNSGTGYKAQYFGAPLVAVGNAHQIQTDIYVTLSVVMTTILVLLISVFGKKRLPLLIVATVSFAALFSLAMVSLFESSISLIAIASGAMILGIAVNYPIHFFTHYIYSKNVEETIRTMVFPMTVGSLTTVGGFLCLRFTDSPLLKDCGLFGAFCLIGAALFSLIFLPHIAGKHIPDTKKPNAVREFFERISSYPIDKKKTPLILIVAITPILLYFSSRVEYDSDLTGLNYMSHDTKTAEQQFNDMAATKRSITLVSKGNTIEEALGNAYSTFLLADSLSSAGYQCDYIGIARVVPPKHIQRERADRWNEYWTSGQRTEEREAIRQTFVNRGMKIEAFERFFATLDGRADIIADEDYATLIEVFGKDYMYSDSLISTFVSQIRSSPDDIDAVVEAVQRNNVARVLNRQSIAQNLIASISDNFNIITFWTSLMVFVAILLSYGRIEMALITFLPMLVSWIWILGIMGLFGIRFNIVNIILSTFIFGLGDDFCIFTTDGCLQSYIRRTRQTSVVRMSILMSGLTGLIGFIALLFARHPAIYSLASVSILGIISVLFISQTLQPFLFRMLVLRPVSAGRPPISLLTIANSMLFFAYFVIGCLLLSVACLIIVAIPMNRKTRRSIALYLMHRMVRGIYRLSVTVKKIEINPHGETFQRPAIIIANHQSMIDILQIIALSPKIVFVVKDWVWKSPIMGLFVRIAGFHPLSDGMDSLVAYRATLNAGYSIVIFPEGSRTDDSTIKRFHKGAFFLADRLGAEILPLMLCNNDETLHKNSFAIYPNQVTIKFFDRIAPNNTFFGSTYRERARAVAAFYRSEYPKLCDEVANSRYCTRKLRDTFMYKGPVLEWYLRVKLGIENTYYDFNRFVPLRGTIVDAGCGYGFLAYVLSMKSSGRRIIAIDYDEKKIEYAANCHIINERVKFQHADITEYEFPNADCFIFSDVLHYLKREAITEVARKISTRLNVGGTIIIRDADIDRHRFNRITEFLSTRIFRFNKADNRLNFFSTEDICTIFKAYGFSYNVFSDPSRAINTYWIIKR